jgi:prolactin regulatory element-binding protein
MQPQPVFTILRGHEFPPTTLRFNTTGGFLLSGSADNTFRLIAVPTSGAGPGALSLFSFKATLTRYIAWITILLTIALMVVIAGVGLKMIQN